MINIYILGFFQLKKLTAGKCNRECRATSLYKKEISRIYLTFSLVLGQSLGDSLYIFYFCMLALSSAFFSTTRKTGYRIFKFCILIWCLQKEKKHILLFFLHEFLAFMDWNNLGTTSVAGEFPWSDDFRLG